MGARDVIRFGLIGAGKHGQRYARHIVQDFPDLQLVALARRDAKQAAAQAEELGCRAFTDYRELLELQSLDAVIIAVPPAMHVEIVSAAARARRAVILEKPVAVTLEAGRRLLAALRSHPVPVLVAQTLRYNAVVRALVERMDEIGPVHSLAFTQRFERSPLPWLDDPGLSGGGIILHTGVHSFDLLRFLTGLEADRAACHMGSVGTRQTEDNFAASIELDGGRALATVCGSRAAPGRTGYIEVAGERATLIADHVLHRADMVVGASPRPLPLGPPIPTVREVLREFAFALRTGAPMPIGIEEGLRAVAIAEACYRAARTGTAVPVQQPI